jgi:hypothetical protein
MRIALYRFKSFVNTHSSVRPVPRVPAAPGAPRMGAFSAQRERLSLQ